MGDNLPAVWLGYQRTVDQVAIGSTHSCVLRTGGAVICWGSNSNGKLGQGSASIFEHPPVNHPVLLQSLQFPPPLFPSPTPPFPIELPGQPRTAATVAASQAAEATPSAASSDDPITYSEAAPGVNFAAIMSTDTRILALGFLLGEPFLPHLSS
jgi:hypothetical protein